MHIARLCSASLLAFAVAGSASAANLAPLKAPPIVGFNWTSCYGGGFLGGARSDGDMTVTDLGNSQFRSYSGGLVAGRVENQHSWNLGSASNFIGGITAGCNWQPVGSPWVVGIEGETGYLKVERTAADPLRSPSLSAVSPDVLATGNVGNCTE
jgi:outer membrane immunogenic protein